MVYSGLTQDVEPLVKLDPLLEAVAAVPWIPEGAEEGPGDAAQRVAFIQTQVIDDLEGQGEELSDLGANKGSKRSFFTPLGAKPTQR